MQYLTSLPACQSLTLRPHTQYCCNPRNLYGLQPFSGACAPYGVDFHDVIFLVGCDSTSASTGLLEGELFPNAQDTELLSASAPWPGNILSCRAFRHGCFFVSEVSNLQVVRSTRTLQLHVHARFQHSRFFRLLSGIRFYFVGFWAPIIFPLSPKYYTLFLQRLLKSRVLAGSKTSFWSSTGCTCDPFRRMVSRCRSQTEGQNDESLPPNTE